MFRLAIGVAPQRAEVREPRVGALDRPAQPHRELLGRSRGTALALLGDDGIVDPEVCQSLPVGAVDGPADGDALGVGEDRPLPSELGPVGRVLAGALPSSWAFLQRSIDRHFGEVQSDDLVVGGNRLLGDGVEHPGFLPLVAAGTDGGVGHLVPTETLAVLPTGPSDQLHQHHFETVTVGDPRAVATEGMGLRMDGEQGFNGGKDGIELFRLERAHDIGVPPLGRWWVGQHPDCLGATTTTGGRSRALSGKYLTRQTDDPYQCGLLAYRT